MHFYVHAGFLLFRLTQTFNQNNQLSQEYSEMKQTCDELGVTEYIETKKKIEQIEQESAAKIASSESEAKANLDSLNEEIQSNNVLIDKLRTEINELLMHLITS